METDVAVKISVGVMVLVNIAKRFGAEGRLGMATAAVCSLVGVVVYAVSNEPVYEPALLWKYFQAFGVVAFGAVGAFEVWERTPRAIAKVTDTVKNTFTSTGNGRS